MTPSATQTLNHPALDAGHDVDLREDATPVHAADRPDAAWWRQAVIYQIYPRSWADSDGDGIGDLPGITSRLPHLRALGVDAIWLSPFYTSPQADAGYDVADYRDIDPIFGSLDDADAMIARAHELDLKVIVDMVPNHSSDEHEWFKAALAAGPGSAERERYMFREGRGEHGELPPNNWESVFGGAAWTRVTEADGRPGQWYLHIFDTKQPDFNWEHPEVRAEFESILRFWLDRGVDGFRVDVAHGLIKEQGLPDTEEERTTMLGHAEHEGEHGRRTRAEEAPRIDHTKRSPMWDQDGVHEVYRAWRQILESYGTPDRILCAEAWVEPQERAVAYVRPDEMHQAFNFDFLTRLVDRRGPARGHHLVAARRGLRRRAVDVGAVEPRRRAPRLASRLRTGHAADERHLGDGPAARPRARPAPCACGDGAHARAARRRVHLPGRGARTAGLDRHAGRVPPGPDVRPHRRRRDRPRRLPRADPVVGRRTVARLRSERQHVAAAARRLRRLRRGPPGGRGRARRSSSTARCSPRVASCPSGPAR